MSAHPLLQVEMPNRPTNMQDGQVGPLAPVTFPLTRENTNPPQGVQFEFQGGGHATPMDSLKEAVRPCIGWVVLLAPIGHWYFWHPQSKTAMWAPEQGSKSDSAFASELVPYTAEMLRISAGGVNGADDTA
jgi:hypothetical protein